MIRAPQLFWLAKRFNRPDYAAYEAEVAAGNPFDLLWYDASMVKPSTAPLDKYFRDAEVVTMRSEWGDKNGLFIGFKGGDNKANHANLDLGSFVLDDLGTRWFMDLGADDYNLPGYFGKQRWSYYRMRAEGHNTLVINPSPEADQELRAVSKIVRFESKPARTFAIADLTQAYAKNARSVKRGVAMLDRKTVLIEDEIACNSAADVWWFAHTPAKVEITDNAAAATLMLDGKELHARLLLPAGAKFELLPAAPLPASAHPEKQNGNRGIHKLAVHLHNASDTRIAVLLSPAGTPMGKIGVVPLAQW